MAAKNESQMRTARIVGPQERVDDRDTPHPRVARGELGERLRQVRSTPSKDPFRRISVSTSATDPNNCFGWIMGNTPDGAVSPQRMEVPDPARMSENIKETAKFFGADVVGITYLDQAYVYSHRARTSQARGEKAGEEIDIPHRFAICMGIAGDYEMYKANPSRISDAEYGLGNARMGFLAFSLAAYIREMGYPAMAHHFIRIDVNPIPLAVMAGLGELGRNGLLINGRYGPRLHLCVVTTDLPLVVDHPVDIGVEDVCKRCMKCARTCPSGSIPFGGKEVHNGVERWRINVDSCYKLRAFHTDKWETCLTCIQSCCYNKPDTWWHNLALWLIEAPPIFLRPLFVKPLVWIDDLIWGKKPSYRVKWLDYDSTYTPEAKPCKVPGCKVHGPDGKAKKAQAAKRRFSVQIGT